MKLDHQTLKIIIVLPKINTLALTRVAHLVGCRPAKQKVSGPIPGQGICLGCKFHHPGGSPVGARVRGN